MFFSLMILMFVSCQNGEKGNRLKKEESKVLTLPSENKVFNDTLVLSKQHHPDAVFCDLDGDFIHQAESCGGGVIYLKNGKFQWIQQE
ncbi:MAG: hypothetical protein HYZ43_15560 [Flavobacteriia bacterium]|nr:hypothetical protein [Flavobacteriia bacterium]